MHRVLLATSRLPVIATLVITVIMGFSLTPAGAAGEGNAGAGASSSGPTHAASVAHGINLSGIGDARSASGYAAYVYADDGMSVANSIDEYGAKSTGLTSLGTIPTGGTISEVLLGQNDIAVSNNSSHGACVIHTDSGGKGLAGLVESFSINLTTGQLTKVSSAPEGDGGNFFPGDVKLSPNGNDAYVDVFSLGDASMLVSFPIGAGCVLGAAVTFNATPQSYSAVSIPNAHQLFAVNREGTLDIYKIAADGLTLSPQTSTPSQVYTPDGAASGTVGGTTFDFSGQFVSGPAGVEAHTLNTTSGALGPVPGSPQTDPLSNDGENVHFTPGLNLVTQTQFDSNSVGAYGITGGSLHFVNTTQLDSSARGPLAQTSISHFLLVENIYSDSISVCRLATSGVSGCVLVATLTTSGQSLFPAGIGAIPA